MIFYLIFLCDYLYSLNTIKSHEQLNPITVCLASKRKFGDSAVRGLFGYRVFFARKFIST